MKPFKELTTKGQIRRLHKMAVKTLQSYDIETRQVRSLWQLYNALFRIDTVDGRKYVLRINLPNVRSFEEIQAEMTWLADIRQNSDIQVPEPIPNRQGELVTQVQTECIPETRNCVIFSWLPGKLLVERLSPDNVLKQGQLMARLHQQTQTFQPPENFYLKDMRSLLPPGEPFWDKPEWFSALKQSKNIRMIFSQSARLIQDSLNQLYTGPAKQHVLHADLHHGNIKIHKGQAAALDFDDSAIGYFVQDAAIALYYLRRRPEFPEFRKAFRQGYESIKNWPETYPGQINILMNARAFQVIDVLLKSDNPQLREAAPQYIEAEIPFLSAYLEKSDIETDG